MIRNCLSILLPALLLLHACKPYGSSESNKKLLQGKWQLISQTYIHPDSIKDNILRDTVYITIKQDSILESINSDHKQLYNYIVKKFDIYWYVEKRLITKSRIMDLSTDTLKMRTYGDYRIYTRKK